MRGRISAFFRESWPAIRVIAVFLIVIAASFAFLTYEPIVSRFDIAWGLAQASAWISGAMLKLVGGVVGFPVGIEGTNLVSGDAFRVDVAPACSGAVPSMIYLAAVLAYPASGRAKLIGAAIGLGVIHGANLLRIVALFLIGLFANEYFHDTHVYIAQALVVALAVATWLFWAGRFANAPGH